MNLEQHALYLIETHSKKTRSIKPNNHHHLSFLTDDDQKPYLVKYIKGHEQHAFLIEKNMYSFLASQLNLQMPNIIDIGFFSGYVYMLREVVIGYTLDVAMQKHPTSAKALCEQAGIILAKLHLKTYEQKGFLNEKLDITPYPIFSNEEFQKLLDVCMNHQLITKEAFDVLKSIDIAYYFDRFPNVLCHGDYHLKNIIADQQSIKTIIDLEWLSSAPFADDVAGFHVALEQHGFKDYVEYFYQGYQQIKPIDSFYFEHIQFYKLYRIITMTSYQATLKENKMQGFYERIKKRLINELNSFLKKSH